LNQLEGKLSSASAGAHAGRDPFLCRNSLLRKRPGELFSFFLSLKNVKLKYINQFFITKISVV
jgi:hypothetical protein